MDVIVIPIEDISDIHSIRISFVLWNFRFLVFGSIQSRLGIHECLWSDYSRYQLVRNGIAFCMDPRVHTGYVWNGIKVASVLSFYDYEQAL